MVRVGVALVMSIAVGAFALADEGNQQPKSVEAEVGSFVLVGQGEDTVALRIVRIDPAPADPTKTGRITIEYEWYHQRGARARFAEGQYESGRGTATMTTQAFTTERGGRYGSSFSGKLACGPFELRRWSASGTKVLLRANEPEDGGEPIELAETGATELTEVDPASSSLVWVRKVSKATDESTPRPDDEPATPGD